MKQDRRRQRLLQQRSPWSTGIYVVTWIVWPAALVTHKRVGLGAAVAVAVAGAAVVFAMAACWRRSLRGTKAQSRRSENMDARLRLMWLRRLRNR